MTATSEFLEDAAGFASRKAIVPELGSENRDNLKAKVVSPDLTLYQVKGANRILYAKLTDAVALNRCDVEFSQARLTEEWFPTYWLPWNVDQTYRITLTPSKKAEVQVDAKHFFTAALTGCMVHVEGDTKSPTVYHSNAMNFQAPPAPPKTSAQAWTGMKKAMAMESRVSGFSATHPKKLAQTKMKSVDAFRYQFETASGQGGDDLVKKEAALVEATVDEVLVVQLGMVFGLKDEEGDWSFYYQSLTKTLRMTMARLERWTVNKCAKFWP
ncbi:MAG TPA: hypothetical protein VGF69_16390 [Thermoanaerobaculia bacterium]|jgi:hypothetical protein